MKKILFLLALLCAVLPARAAAADFTLNSVQVDTQSNTLSASLRTQDPCLLYTALFSEAGQALGVSISLQDTTWGYDTEISVPNAFSCNLSGAAFARAVLLEYATLKPLCPRFDLVSLLHAETKSADVKISDAVVTISTDRDSLADYMLLEYNTSLLPDLLKAPFWNSPPSGGAAAPGAFPAYGRVSSVLDAMKTGLDSVDGGRGSVFDKYAAQDFQNQTAALIRGASASTAGILGVGHGVAVSPGSPVAVDCGALGMRQGAQYAFVAVARAVSGGLDVFRAAFPLALSEQDPEEPGTGEPGNPGTGNPDTADTAAPVITGIDLNLKKDTYTDSSGVTHTLDSWSGTAVLTFSEPLYALDRSVSPPLAREVDRGTPEAAGRDTERFLSAADLVEDQSSSVSVITNDAFANTGTRILSLRFFRAEPGASIAFLPTLCDAEGNVRAKGMVLTMEIEERRMLTHYDRDGLPVYETAELPGLACSPSYWYPSA